MTKVGGEALFYAWAFEQTKPTLPSSSPPEHTPHAPNHAHTPASTSSVASSTTATGESTAPAQSLKDPGDSENSDKKEGKKKPENSEKQQERGSAGVSKKQKERGGGEGKEGKSGHVFAARDVLVPWHVRLPAPAPKQEGDSRPDTLSPTGNPTGAQSGDGKGEGGGEAEGESAQPEHVQLDEEKQALVFQRYCHVYVTRVLTLTFLLTLITLITTTLSTLITQPHNFLILVCSSRYFPQARYIPLGPCVCSISIISIHSYRPVCI